MAKFVPVSFTPDEVSLRRVEHINNLSDNSIVLVQWARDPSRHHNIQYIANLFISYRLPEAANKTIHNGLIINGKKVWAAIHSTVAYNQPRQVANLHPPQEQYAHPLCNEANTMPAEPL